MNVGNQVGTDVRESRLHACDGFRGSFVVRACGLDAKMERTKKTMLVRC